MLAVVEAAKQLNCSAQTVRNLIRSGRLPASRRLGASNGAWQISEAAVAAFIEQTTTADVRPGAVA